MRKFVLLFGFACFVFLVNAQKHNIVNSSIALKNANKTDGEEMVSNLIDAKNYIDEAFLNTSTSDEPKMWNYRAKVYLKIALLKDQKIDNDAIFKAKQSHIRCLEKDKKGRVVVRKWTKEEDVVAGLIQCGYKLFNMAIDEYNNENNSKALKLYDEIFKIFDYDSEDQLKRGNITKETVLHNSFFAARRMKDNERSKVLLQNLIDLNFNDPSIYVHMSDILQEEGNDDDALKYLSLGRDYFENDPVLINSQINLYIKLNRTDELIDKLSDAIELDDMNDLLFFNRATVYDQKDMLDEAIIDYKKSIELNPDNFNSNYNLGALFFNRGVELRNEANNSSSDKLYNKLKKESEVFFDDALPFLETSLSLDPNDKNTLLSLKQLYYLKGDYKKSKEMDGLIKSQ
ncbi:tetratricopeptide repeat protein [Bacteroidota bacterium]|nr:tetratricopeptide repeat protein [Bacteroidota bacterium]MDC3229761.1 tetratricopeptide repeat protein [Bacteroidota bacterium]